MTKIKRTKEEKQKLVSEFKKSGLSKVQWCQNNNIPVSTFNGWIFPNNQKTKEKCQFVEINVPTAKTELISIEYKNFKINIPQIKLVVFSVIILIAFIVLRFNTVNIVF